MLASYAVAAQSLVAQRAALAQAQSALAAGRDQRAAASREIDALRRSNSADEASVKSSETALAAAQSVQDRAAEEIKAANLELGKWRTAAGRVGAAEQYAARKVDPK
jgi:hypothetical protein